MKKRKPKNPPPPADIGSIVLKNIMPPEWPWTTFFKWFVKKLRRS